jgi:hypothetical protein
MANGCFFANCQLPIAGMTAAKTQSQELMANGFFLTLPPPIQTTVHRAEAQFSTLQVAGGRGNWGPNDRSQSTEVQAVSGFPAQPVFSAGC